MTFQEAQAEFSSIAGDIHLNLTKPELRNLSERLSALQNALPLAREFDTINDAIIALSPKITGIIVAKTLKDLQSRTATLEAATTLLNRTAAQAAKDAGTLSFEKPKLLAAGLTTGISTLQELRGAVKAGDLDTAAAKADALFTLFAQLQSTIKST